MLYLQDAGTMLTFFPKVVLDPKLQWGLDPGALQHDAQEDVPEEVLLVVQKSWNVCDPQPNLQL